METINLPQLRLPQLQTLTESATKITENLTEVAPQVLAVQEAFRVFQVGMTKSVSASNKKTLDRTRDMINSGFFKSVGAEQLYPYQDAATQQIVSKLAAVVSKYSYELNRLSYDEQTAKTDNMITELAAIDLSTLPAVNRWIVLIKTANDDFKLTVKKYIKDRTEEGDSAAASQAAIAVEDALKELFTILYAHVLVSKANTLENAYKELITLVNSYK